VKVKVRRRLRFTLYMLLFVLSLIPVQVFGHTALIEMDPKPESQLEQSPEHVYLLFNEKLEAISEQSLLVEDDTGKSIEAGPAEIGDKGKSILLTLPKLSKGTYTVSYHVMSLDGHMVEGGYKFSVLTDKDQAVDPVPSEPDATIDTPNKQVEPDVTPDIPEKQVEPEVPSQVTADYGIAPIEGDQSLQNRWSSVFAEIAAVDVLRMLYFLVFLFLVGMIIWYVVLRRGRSDEDAQRHRNWILQVQRIHILVLIVVIVEFVHQAVGFEDWQPVKDILFHTTAGTSWSLLLVLSLIGLGVLQRNKFVDMLWILAIIATMTQIGHSASSQYRIIASVVTAVHLLAAAIWAGGLLYLILLWGRYRHVAEKLILKFSNASLIAITLLVLSGIVSSLLYLNNISYVFETRWGHILLIKVAVVVIVIIIGAIIRRRFIRNGHLQVGTWIKLDFVMLLVLASLAALLTAVEPNPPNEPLHWHVMGESVHMTAEITPNIPGDNRFAVSVWLPENSGDPKTVSMQITMEPKGNPKEIALTKLDRIANDYGFGGFNEFTFQAESDQLDHAGTWLIDIEVTDQQGQTWKYKKQIRVY
jgi:copper transport protein